MIEDKETRRGGDKEITVSASPPTFLRVSLSPFLLVFAATSTGSQTRRSFRVLPVWAAPGHSQLSINARKAAASPVTSGSAESSLAAVAAAGGVSCCAASPSGDNGGAWFASLPGEFGRPGLRLTSRRAYFTSSSRDSVVLMT